MALDYQRTALDWLAHFDAHRDEIEPTLRRMRAAWAVEPCSHSGES